MKYELEEVEGDLKAKRAKRKRIRIWPWILLRRWLE
jgi:hypothetical protein